jgi:Xaa-Pro aminopeptidase
MEPSIKRGLTFWDRALMPLDEFEERVRSVRRIMRQSGLHAMVIAGNMYLDADLLWLTAGNVDGVLVLPLEGEPVIFTNSGSRESFSLRELTWIQDLSYRGPHVGRAVRSALAARNIPSGRIGTAGFSVLSLRSYEDLRDALSGYEVEDASALLQALRAEPRPRERAAVRIALGMAMNAARAAEAAFANGSSNAAAVIEAERVARLAGAWDVRILANLDGSYLRPFERPSQHRQNSLLMWVATRYQGYWADQVVCSSNQPKTVAAVAVEAMFQAARAGARASTVARAGLSVLPNNLRDQALGYGLGGGIGIQLTQSPLIQPDCDEILAPGVLLSVRVLTDGGLASRLIEIGRDGASALDPIMRSPGSATPGP